MKLTISKSKNSVHFYVQKSVRKNGKTTSVMVENLGNLDEVKTKACGKDPYAWAQEYVNELNRREYEDRKEIIVRYSPSKLIKKDEKHLFNCGYLFLQDIYYKLGLDRICSDIMNRHSFDYDLNDILSKLIYTRVLFPSSKLKSVNLARSFIEQPAFDTHEVYRALSVLAQENDFIQSELYKNSQNVTERRKDILYYDCTNYFFELEEEDDFRKYGHCKQHQPLPIVGMGLFMDYDGIPLAFDVFPGNKNEQPTLKPLEKKVINDFGISRLIVCTDAGLSSKANRKFNDMSIKGEQIRSFITTQSVKSLSADLKEFALSDEGWKLPGDDHEYILSKLDPVADYDKIFYKDRWITEDLTEKARKSGTKPLEQHLIVSFSLKYRAYLRKIRENQVSRAVKMIEKGSYRKKAKNQNDPSRFISKTYVTKDGEVCSAEVSCLDTAAIANEEMYDGFYAVCTNDSGISVSDVVKINRKRWEIEECFRIMKTEFKARPVYLQREDRIKAHFLTCFIALIVYRLLEKKLGGRFTCEEILDTLKAMSMYRPGEKLGYMPAYTRTDLTDALHECAGIRTDYETVSDMDMKKTIRKTKQKKK